MTAFQPLTRRGMLGGFAALGMLALLPRVAHASSSDAAQALLSLIDDRASAAALGQRWIDEDGSHATPQDVVQRLVGTLQAQGWAGGNDPDDLRRRFTDAVRADYRSGATVTVEGWQLARSQADLCAVAYFATAGLL